MLKVGDSNPYVDALLARGRFLLRNRWQYLGFRLATFDCPTMPFDPALVTRFRREIDPSFLPLWMRHAYRTPSGGECYFDYHCLTFESPNNLLEDPETKVIRGPHVDFLTHPPLQSSHAPIRRPHSYITILHYRSKLVPDGVIGVPRPFSVLDLNYYREITWLTERISRAEQIDAKIEDMREQARVIDGRYRARQDYKWDHDWAHISKLVNALDVQDRKLLLANADMAALYGQRIAASNIGHSLPS